MPFPGLLGFFSFPLRSLLLAQILATLHYTTTVAMATKGEAANSTATALPGAAAASRVHGYTGARVCRCMSALVRERMGVGVHGCVGECPTGGPASLCSLAGMSVPQTATSHEQAVHHRKIQCECGKIFAWVQCGHLQLQVCIGNGDECWKGRDWGCKDVRHAASSWCTCKW